MNRKTGKYGDYALFAILMLNLVLKQQAELVEIQVRGINFEIFHELLDWKENLKLVLQNAFNG